MLASPLQVVPQIKDSSPFEAFPSPDDQKFTKKRHVGSRRFEQVYSRQIPPTFTFYILVIPFDCLLNAWGS